MNNIYTLRFNSKISPNGQDWDIGRVISQSTFGVTVEDSRGNQRTYPAHNIEYMEKRNGW